MMTLLLQNMAAMPKLQSTKPGPENTTETNKLGELAGLFVELSKPHARPLHIANTITGFFDAQKIPIGDKELLNLIKEIEKIKLAQLVGCQESAKSDVDDGKQAPVVDKDKLTTQAAGPNLVKHEERAALAVHHNRAASKSNLPRPYDPKGILNTNELHPVLADKVETLLIRAREQGLNVFLFEGYRTLDRQTKLYTQDTGVTHAASGYSFHNYGLAADVVFYDDKGNPSWDEGHDWQMLGQIGKETGLEWGGDFKSLKDRTHFEYHPQHSIHTIIDLYNKQGLEGVWNELGG